MNYFQPLEKRPALFPTLGKMAAGLGVVLVFLAAGARAENGKSADAAKAADAIFGSAPPAQPPASWGAKKGWVLGASGQSGAVGSNALIDKYESDFGGHPAAVMPSNVVVLCNAYLADKQLGRGVRFLKGVLASNPEADSARLGLAILLHRQGKTAEAVQLLDEVISRKSAWAENREYAARLKRDWQ